MRMKIHIGFLILVLTCLAVVSQQQAQQANQEIVFHFTDVNTSSNEAQSTIQVVKNKLHELGVENIKISNQDDEKLKITYYSNTDIASIKEVLFNEMKLNLDFAFNDGENKSKHLPDSNKVNFDLDIYEIQNTHQTSSGFDGCVLVKKSELDRYYDPNIFVALFAINVKAETDFQKAAIRAWRLNENKIHNPYYIFPEVRAGPTVHGNS